MKILTWFIGMIVFLFTFSYILLFTSYANSLLTPLIEKEIQAQTKTAIKLLKYQLSMNDFEVYMELTPNNTIHIYGNYSLFSQSFNSNYIVDFKELSTLQNFIGEELDGRFYTEGNILGNVTRSTIVGLSKIA